MRREGVLRSPRSVSRFILAFRKSITPSRESDVRITPAEKTYGSHAMAKSFLKMLVPAVQRPKSRFFCLHRWCKGQIVVFSVCTGGASGKKWFLRFAPPVQAFPKALWPLQRSIKDILQGLETSFFRRTHVNRRTTGCPRTQMIESLEASWVGSNDPIILGHRGRNGSGEGGRKGQLLSVSSIASTVERKFLLMSI